MYSEPEDVEAQCNARLSIGDDAGDNSATMRCQLVPDHEGPHKEVYDREPFSYDGPLVDVSGTVTVTWHGCAREEREAWDARYHEEHGPECELCYDCHFGECPEPSQKV